MRDQVYARAPLRVVNGIPVFCEPSAYTENYEVIASDHLRAEAVSGANPFIPEHLWTEMEGSTVALVNKYAKPGERILDVGVGLGRILRQLPQLQRYGTDISLTYLQRTATDGIEVCCALLEDLPYHANSFDVVTCTDVLEHVLDLNRACANIVNVLRPGGVLIVRVPYREDLGVYTAPSCPYEFVHLRNFDEHALQLLFTKIVGARVLEFATVGMGSRPSRLGSALPAPTGNSAAAAVFRTARWAAAAAYRKVARWRRQPLAINVVVQKPSQSDEGGSKNG